MSTTRCNMCELEIPDNIDRDLNGQQCPDCAEDYRPNRETRAKRASKFAATFAKTGLEPTDENLRAVFAKAPQNLIPIIRSAFYREHGPVKVGAEIDNGTVAQINGDNALLRFFGGYTEWRPIKELPSGQ